MYGTFTQDIQDSTIFSEAVEGGISASENYTRDQISIVMEGPSLAIPYLENHGFNGFTVTQNSIVILRFTDGNKQAEVKSVNDLEDKIESLETALQNEGLKTKFNITGFRSEFITAAERQSVILEEKRRRDPVLHGIHQGRDIYNALERAEARNQAYLDWRGRREVYDADAWAYKPTKEHARYTELRKKQLDYAAKGKKLSNKDISEIRRLEAYFVEPLSAFFAADRELYEAAKKEVDQIAADIVKMVEGAFVSEFSIKRPERAAIKTVRWYTSQPNALGDGARTNIIARSDQDADFIFNELKRRYGIEGVTRVEQYRTDLGYPKRLMEVITSPGKLAEIQVMTPQGYLAKDGINWFPEEHKDSAQEYLAEVQDRVGIPIADGAGHLFYEVERDTNVPVDLRKRASGISRRYYDVFLNEQSEVDVTLLRQDMAEFIRDVDAAGNRPQATKERDGHQSKIQNLKSAIRNQQPSGEEPARTHTS